MSVVKWYNIKETLKSGKVKPETIDNPKDSEDC